MKTTAQILRDYRGPALFSFGFRPFFLLASIWAALSVPLWLLSYLAAGDTAAAIFTRDWHVHEMLFGYLAAVIVGYMTIAGANWTGHYPVAGRPIVVLVAIWIAGRAAMLAYPMLGLAAAIVDSAFLVLFSLALWRELLRRDELACRCSHRRHNAARDRQHRVPRTHDLPRHRPRVGAHDDRPYHVPHRADGRTSRAELHAKLASAAEDHIAACTLRAFRYVLAYRNSRRTAAWVALPDSRLSGALLLIAGLGLLIRLALERMDRCARRHGSDPAPRLFLVRAWRRHARRIRAVSC
jgi:uncharacterized protein involved in response to NO